MKWYSKYLALEGRYIAYKLFGKMHFDEIVAVEVSNNEEVVVLSFLIEHKRSVLDKHSILDLWVYDQFDEFHARWVGNLNFHTYLTHKLEGSKK